MRNFLTHEEAQQIDNQFTYHSLTGGQLEAYDAIRRAGRLLATTIGRNCKPSADRSAALRMVREAVMTANVSVALEG